MKTASRSTLKALVLAIAIASVAGCDRGAPAPKAEAVSPPGASPEARYQLDAARKRVWSLTVEGGVFVHDLASGRRTAISLPEWMWAGRRKSPSPTR